MKSGTTNTDVTSSTIGQSMGSDSSTTGTTVSRNSHQHQGPFTAMSEKAFDTFDEGMNKVKDQGTKILESKKTSAVHYLKDYAMAVQEAAVSLQELKHGEATPYLQKTSDKLTQLAQFLQSKTVRSMADDVVVFARKNPSLFIAGSFVAGALVARFAKASTQSPQFTQTSRAAKSRKEQAQISSIVDALDNSANRHLDSQL